LARGVRPDDRRDCEGLFDRSADARPADRASQVEDPRRENSIRCTVTGRSPRATRNRTSRGLPGVQRRLLGLFGWIFDAGRSVWRGDPPGTPAHATVAGARGGWSPGADAAARIAARRAHDTCRRDCAARKPGPGTLEP